jgi:hypothetical protein
VRRLSLISGLAAGGVGISLATLAWFAVGERPSGQPPNVDSRTGTVQAETAASQPLAAFTNPLFQQLPDPVVRISGVSRSPRGASALTSVNNAEPVWLTRGQSVEGVTLVDVGASQVVIETSNGRRIVELGQTSDPNAEAAAVQQMDLQPDEAPPGYRQPMPPADAPSI